METSPNSLMMTAVSASAGSLSTRFKRVVLPAPRKPVRIETGTTRIGPFMKRLRSEARARDRNRHIGDLDRVTLCRGIAAGFGRLVVAAGYEAGEGKFQRAVDLVDIG